MSIYRTLYEFFESILLPTPIAILLLLCLVLIGLSFPATFSRHVKKVRICLVLALVFYYGMSIPGTSNFGLKYLETRYEAPDLDTLVIKDPVIVVLSAGWSRKTREGQELHLGEAGWERLEKAIQLWQSIGGKLLLSGRLPWHIGKSNAQYMKEVAISMGIPESVIILEEQSINTYQNLLYSKALIDPTHHDLFLVTSAWHLPRAMAVAKGLELPFHPVPCHYYHLDTNGLFFWLPHQENLKRLRPLFHEVMGMLAYWLKGYL